MISCRRHQKRTSLLVALQRRGCLISLENIFLHFFSPRTEKTQARETWIGLRNLGCTSVSRWICLDLSKLFAENSCLLPPTNWLMKVKRDHKTKPMSSKMLKHARPVALDIVIWYIVHVKVLIKAAWSFWEISTEVIIVLCFTNQL